MSIVLRVLLIIGSIFAFLLCLRKIRQAKLKTSNAIVWLLGCILLIIMSVFPNFIALISYKIGFVAPVNFVFLIIISFLLIQVLIDNININELSNRIKDLNHYIALMEYDGRSKEEDDKH